MSCPAPLGDELLEDYLQDRLDEAARRSVEEHYFACPSCLARIETLQALRPALLREAALRPPRRRKPVGLATAATAAAAFLVGALVVRQIREPHGKVSPSEPTGSPAAVTAAPDGDGRELQQLAPLTAAPYRRATLRDATAALPGFEAGMEAYGRGDYAGAVRQLEPLAAAHADHPEVLFFLGVSHLLSGRVADGVARLEQTTVLGDTPYLEQATFYLAKARLAGGDVEKAEAALEAVIRLRGDLEVPARELQRRLQARAMPSPRS